MYKFTEKMQEISGLGGFYEEYCRRMLKIGLEWFDKHPNTNPLFEDVNGMCVSKNNEARNLELFIRRQVDEATGAMHQTIIQDILWIRKHTWDEYVKKMEEEKS